MKHLVRDEGVAGSNPATPTIFTRRTAGTACRLACKGVRLYTAAGATLTT